MNVVVLNSINEVSAEAWDQVCDSDYPFTRHAFLKALEDSQSVCAATGWQAQHLLVRNDEGTAIAAMPLYLKSHSYGEYVFDWSWAAAYERHGLNYYPKLVSAIPFTPATGPRLGYNKTWQQQHPDLSTQLYPLCRDTLLRLADQYAVSSIHILFPDQQENAAWTELDFLARAGVQYHWYNDDYTDFDAFLADFSSRKRKNVRKERQRVVDQGITFEVLSGEEIEARHWDQFFHFYQLTYAKRSGHAGYLKREFFTAIGRHCAEQVVMTLACHKDRYVAGALCFRDSNTLYGRYWGCLQEFDMLHFETCYYQGIEYCIKQGLQHFDPGAQGEHKIQRGFRPVPTCSAHWIRDPRFRQAIDQFVHEEARELQHYRQSAAASLPFKKSEQL